MVRLTDMTPLLSARRHSGAVAPLGSPLLLCHVRRLLLQRNIARLRGPLRSRLLLRHAKNGDDVAGARWRGGREK
jgi:hypothetical protein